MVLDLHQIIIHELEKEAEANEVQLHLAEAVQPLDERSRDLAERLNGAFTGKMDVLQGYLSTPEDALFPGYFQEWLDSDESEAAFVEFSRHTMEALKVALEGVVGAKGGYLIYADYTYFDSHYLGIFLVRNTEGIVFQKTEQASRFFLELITYLNIEKLALACRIQIDAFRQGEQRCVELIKHAKSQKAISDYFINWIGLDQAESSKKLTSTFLEVVNHLPLPTDEESGQTLTEGEFREKVMNFALESPRQTIQLEQFDKAFYGDQQPTKQYMEENEVELDQSFRFDENTLRKFYNGRVFADGIALSFNRSHFQRGQIEIEGDSVVIRSEALVEKLLALMEE